jgi:hypothetical protein
VNDHPLRGGIDEDDRIGGRRLLDDLVADQIEHEAGMQAALRGKRDAGNGAGNVAMDMAEEDVPDIAVAFEQVKQTPRLLEAERIEQLEAEFDRRMMQEDVGLPARRVAKPGIQPG